MVVVFKRVKESVSEWQGHSYKAGDSPMYAPCIQIWNHTLALNLIQISSRSFNGHDSYSFQKYVDPHYSVLRYGLKEVDSERKKTNISTSKGPEWAVRFPASLSKVGWGTWPGLILLVSRHIHWIGEVCKADCSDVFVSDKVYSASEKVLNWGLGPHEDQTAEMVLI